MQKIFDTPREGMGSLAGMQLYSAIAQRMEQQTVILQLTGEAEKRWKRIADSVLILDGKEIPLRQGCAEFDAVMHGRNETLALILFPKDTFTHRMRDFVIIRFPSKDAVFVYRYHILP